MEPDLERISTPEATKKRRQYKKNEADAARARREPPVFVPFCASDIADAEVSGETVQCVGVHYLVEFAESLQSAPDACAAGELASHQDAWMSRPLRRRDREAQDSQLGKGSASLTGQFCKLHVANVFHFPARRCILRKQDAFPGKQIVQQHPAGDTEEAPDGAGVGDDLADFLWDVQVSTKGKAIRRRPMTEILMGKLCYSLSSTAAVAEVVQTVLRMMDVLAENTNQEDVNPSKSHVRTILVKLDCLHSLSRRVFAKPNQPDRRTVRFLSADSSTQANRLLPGHRRTDA
ncbi:unnamed protein product [Symbiodinium sp. CCMP2592]|nr:unnamed protein product [Symbiodinium sp. CCMP2592]